MVGSWFGIARHRAVFYDRKGQFVGSKCFKWSHSDSFGISKTVFPYKDGYYNIDPYSSRAIIDHFFFNEYVYSYVVDNPDPLVLTSNVEPIMNPEIYKKRLTNQFVTQLHKAGESGLAGLLTPKTIIIFLIIIGAIIYFASGGQLLPNG